jgi:hypothetical protein
MIDLKVTYAHTYHAYPRPRGGLAFGIERDLRPAVERDMARALVVIEEEIDEYFAAREFFPVINWSSYLANEARGFACLAFPEEMEEDEPFDWLFAGRGWYQTFFGWRFHP